MQQKRTSSSLPPLVTKQKKKPVSLPPLPTTTAAAEQKADSAFQRALSTNKAGHASLSDPTSTVTEEEFPKWACEPRDFFHFEIIHESKKSMARVGRIHTPHGISFDKTKIIMVLIDGKHEV
jgi:hypothetical protein